MGACTTPGTSLLPQGACVRPSLLLSLQVIGTPALSLAHSVCCPVPGELPPRIIFGSYGRKQQLQAVPEQGWSLQCTCAGLAGIWMAAGVHEGTSLVGCAGPTALTAQGNAAGACMGVCWPGGPGASAIDCAAAGARIGGTEPTCRPAMLSS